MRACIELSSTYNAQHMSTEPASLVMKDANGSASPLREFFSLSLYVIVAGCIALCIRIFIATPYLVSGASMESTFETYDYLIIDRLSYQFNEPERGDVIVMRYPYDPTRTFIKRIIGLPGETLSIDGSVVTIQNAAYPEGFALSEPYVGPEYSAQNNLSITLGSDEYFVLGDNRRASADSRTWGTLPRQNIIGRAYVRLYPFDQIETLPGEVRYQ